MNLGKEINTRIVEDMNAKQFIDAGFGEKWLKDINGGSEGLFGDDDLRIYVFILNHYKKHHKTPSREIVQFNYPNYEFSKRDITTAEVIESAVKRVREHIAARYVDRTVDFLDAEDINGAAELFGEAHKQLSRDFQDMEPMAEVLGDQNFDVHEWLNQEVTKGSPFGIKQIDDEFYGFQPGQLITILGRQKATKTSLLVRSAVKAWEEGFTSLMFSVELNNAIMREKMYAIGAEVSATNLRRRQLTTTEERRLIEFDKRLKGDNAEALDLILSEKKKMMTVSDIRDDIERYNPNVVYIDGFYFMMDEKSHKSTGWDYAANEQVADDLKILATEYDIPIIVTTQSQEKQQGAGKRGIEGRTIMGGTGLLKTSDLVIGADFPEREGPMKGTQRINCVLSRFDQFEDIYIKWDWTTSSLETREAPVEEQEGRVSDKF